MSGHGNHAAAAWHLQRWLEAYGSDLVLPPGTAIERPAAPEPAAASATAPPADAQAASAAPPPAPPPAPAGSQTRSQPTTQPQTPEKQELPETKALRELRREVLPCTSCKLHENRQYTVFGEGNHQARVLFVGEAPGTREDQTGRPFVGPAGQLLDKILEGAMGLSRDDVYIANINKCHPPGNRDPEPDEVAACLPYLRRQVEILKPEVIVCLGRVAGQNLLGSTESTSALRGRQHDYHGIPVVVTWHPAYLLRQPARKRDTWEDIKRVNKLLGMPDTPKRK
ncbi:MAG: uracil-DNA glycosylase [Planctomycetota bacterium]